MQYFLQGKNIIFKDKAGQIKCSDFDHALHSRSPTTNFIEKKSYHSVVSLISDSLNKNRQGKERDTLILNSDFHSYPGLCEAITEKLGNETQIKSDIEVQLSILNLPNGEYTYIEVNKDSTSTFSISFQGDSFSVLENDTISNELLKQELTNTFKDVLKPNIETENILEVLFNYSNVIAANKLLTDTKYGLVGNETAYNEKNLYFTDSAFKTIFNADLILPTFFRAIATCIETHIKAISKNKKAIIQSTLLDYSRVIGSISPNENLFYSNKFQQVLEIGIIEFKAKKLNPQVEFEIYPSKQKTNLPFTSWILTETNNLLLNFKLHQKNYQIDISPLTKDFSNTIFSLGNQYLLKYFVCIEENSCGNLQLKLKGLNGVEYFKTINC
jgi:hypothetical protein